MRRYIDEQTISLTLPNADDGDKLLRTHSKRWPWRLTRLAMLSGAAGSFGLIPAAANGQTIDGQTLSNTVYSNQTLTLGAGHSATLSNIGLDNSTIEMSAEASRDTFLNLAAGGSLSGNGTITLMGDNTNYIYAVGNGTATIESGITIRGIAPGGHAIGQGGAVLVNRGTIISESQNPINSLYYAAQNEGWAIAQTGSRLLLAAGSNLGTVSAVAGSSLTIGGPYTNFGTISVTDGTLALSGTFTNSGTISTTGGRLYVDSNYSFSTYSSAQAFAIPRTNTPMYIRGPLNNFGNALDTHDANGGWQLNQGTISGGSLYSSDGTPFVSSGTGTLSDISLIGPLVITGTSTTNLAGNWDASGTITVE